MERDKPAPAWLTSAVRRGILMAGNAENLAVGQGVRSALIYRHFVMCLPTAGSIVHAAGVPVKYLTASPGTMSTVASSAFASSARALPGCENGWFCSQPSSVPADGGFCLCRLSISQKLFHCNITTCRLYQNISTHHIIWMNLI